MKFVVYGDDARLGAVHGDRILDLGAAAKAAGSSGTSAVASLLDLIESGDRGLDLVRSLQEQFDGSDQPGLFADFAAVRLHPPYPGRRLAFAGGNYPRHVADAYTNSGKPTTVADAYERVRRNPPSGFWVVAPPVGPGAEVAIPSSASELFDYEGELAIVLGRGGRQIDAGNWGEHVWGTTLVIDWSVRQHDMTRTQLPFYGHKVFDGSTSIGPWIAVGEADPADWNVETRVNGELRQTFSTSEMIHSFGEILAQLSADLTLLPGDLISGGTGSGTAYDSTATDADGRKPTGRFLKPGDKVQVSAPNLGTLLGLVGPRT